MSTGVAAVALALRVPISSAAPSGTALAGERRATYVSLAEAGLADPSMRVDPSLAQGAADEVAAVYAGWPAHLQRGAHKGLHAVEGPTSPGVSQEGPDKPHPQ